MIGVYHKKDLDGWCSGAIMKLKYPDIKLIGYDYGEEIPDIPKGEPVIMSDVSFPMEKMLEISSNCDYNLLWIDHHISAIKDFEEFVGNDSPFCQAVLSTDVAACELTWKTLMKTEVPSAVYLLGVYDTWRAKDDPLWDDSVMPFQMAMKAVCNHPDKFPTRLFEDEDMVNSFIKDGRAIVNYNKTNYQSLCDLRSFELELDGYKAIAINHGDFSSRIFDSVWDPNKYDIMICFAYSGKGYWTVSFYTEKPDIDVSEIAKKRGGGGHKGAAGCQLKDINTLITR